MMRSRQATFRSFIAGAALVGVGWSGARAEVVSDKAAAIVVWPVVYVSQPADTLIQLGNTSAAPVRAHCFYSNANTHCSNTGQLCFRGGDCCTGSSCGLCLPGWSETDFNVVLTAGQPIAWQASEGLQTFCSDATVWYPCIPIDGTSRKGPPDPTDPSGRRFQSNAGTRIPSVPEAPFVGELRCIVVDDTGAPVVGSGANVLVGHATTNFGGVFDAAKSNAIGIRALDNPANDASDGRLVLGGDGAQYEGCPSVLILNHFFDFAEDPVTNRTITTFPIFVPCTANYLAQVPGSAIAQYLVFNEFEQRFSTSNTVRCFYGGFPLSNIDTTQNQNSIFSAGVEGTLVGQTRVSAIGDGLLGLLVEERNGATVDQSGPSSDPEFERFFSAETNVDFQGQRPTSDVITLP
ncbi:MAG TPA: hypothetical protein VL403_20695 [Candidatus Kryptonia bacterium]|nr:hypothetical protein [Candidatus Kryptonia bacterium]